MNITCQQCNTIFRLDEKLLKPAGSKVRCSQCRNVFLAYPPAPVDDTPAESSAVREESAKPQSDVSWDQEDANQEAEFDFDAQFEDEAVDFREPGDEPQSSAEELGLSDIEQMLEDDTLVQDGMAENIGTDHEGGEQWSEDLDDDDADTESDDNGSGDEEMELDLGLEDVNAEAEEERDLSAPDPSDEDERDSTTTKNIDVGDMKLELAPEDNDSLPAEEDELPTDTALTTSATSDATVNERFADSDDPYEEAFEADEMAVLAEVSAKPKKRGAVKALILILILALLGGGGYFGYDYVTRNDIQIPYLSQYINPKPQDPFGVLKITTLDLEARFLEHEKSGSLFIVTGKVQNGYDVACKNVLLKGELFIKGKKLTKTEQAYAGVIIPNKELAKKGLLEIKKQLKSPLGAAAAVQIDAGQTAPFMIVFSDLPTALDEYDIELVSATKVQ